MFIALIKVMKNLPMRLKVSISSIPSHLIIYIITWHNDLENKLEKDFPIEIYM